MQKPHLTEQAKSFIRSHFEESNLRPNIAVDATCGNGNDTLFLAEIAKKVFAFDIQEIALKNTSERLIESGYITKTRLLLTGHEHIQKHVTEKADVIMFNLGYLPQADKSITTLTDTTLAALNSSLDLLTDNGILSVLCYPGHRTGKIETDAVKQWIDALSADFSYQEYLSNYPNDHSPILYQITKV